MLVSFTGTVHISEEYPCGCQKTPEIDVLRYINVGLVIVYLTIFATTNISILYSLRNEADLFDGFRIKSMTVGLVFLVVTLVGFMILLLEPTGAFVIFYANLEILLCLVLFVLKEGSFTGPFILGKLQQLLSPILTIPLESRSQDTIEEDDCGIFVENPEPNRLTMHSSAGQPNSEQQRREANFPQQLSISALVHGSAISHPDDMPQIENESIFGATELSQRNTVERKKGKVLPKIVYIREASC